MAINFTEDYVCAYCRVVFPKNNDFDNTFGLPKDGILAETSDGRQYFFCSEEHLRKYEEENGVKLEIVDEK